MTEYRSPVSILVEVINQWDFDPAKISIEYKDGFVDLAIDLGLNHSLKIHTNCQKDFDEVWKALQNLINRTKHAN